MPVWDEALDAKLARAIVVAPKCDARPRPPLLQACPLKPAWVVSAKGGPRKHSCGNAAHLGEVVDEVWDESGRKVRVFRIKQ